jgi:hypothetical protein
MVYSPIYTEEAMKWSKYDTVVWFQDTEKKEPRGNQTRHWLLDKAHPELAQEEYEVDASEFNPSAELARAFELMQANIAADGKKPPYDYLSTTASFKWNETKREPALSGVKTMHNFAHNQISRFSQIWSSYWGQPNNDHYIYQPKDYLKLAHKFYTIYHASINNSIDYFHTEEINENIRLHCDVGLHKTARLDQAKFGNMQLGDDSHGLSEHDIGIIPKSLLGYLWFNLADDIANKKRYGFCQGRAGCIRVFGTNVRSSRNTCSKACRTHLSRSPNVEIFPSIFERREV